MSSEQPKLNDSEADNQTTSGKPEAQPQPAIMASSPSGSATRTQPEADDADEARSAGDVDFGQLLDQFEQEQATLEEGEVVRGTVVGLSERGVVIDFGYKSEGIVNPAEFT
jgi:small subunit ribosomal protein S1